MAYFENVVYRYDYDQAVRDAATSSTTTSSRKVSSDVRDQRHLPERKGEQVDQVDVESGAKQLDLLDDERAFDATAVEREITAPDSNPARSLQELKSYT